MKDKNKPEREKGGAPADYMPAIFGWLNMEDQAEQAREISAISKNTEKGEQKIIHYIFSKLNEEELKKIKDLENEINNNKDEYVNLIAYSKKSD